MYYRQAPFSVWYSTAEIQTSDFTKISNKLTPSKFASLKIHCIGKRKMCILRKYEHFLMQTVFDP
jgi:hypothetical protein